MYHLVAVLGTCVDTLEGHHDRVSALCRLDLEEPDQASSSTTADANNNIARRPSLGTITFKRLLVSGSHDTTIRLWDRGDPTRELFHRFCFARDMMYGTIQTICLIIAAVVTAFWNKYSFVSPSTSDWLILHHSLLILLDTCDSPCVAPLFHCSISELIPTILYVIR
jgi:WD40 repeat protein